MSTSIFLAKLIGPIFLVGAIGMLLYSAIYARMAQEFLRSAALIYLSGLITMAVGLAIVLNHNIWTADWRVLVTILGWLATIGGAMRIALPDQVQSIGGAMLGKPSAIRVGGSSWLALGAILTFFGYIR